MEEILYPRGYTEPEPSTGSGAASPYRDKAAVIAILRDATKDEQMTVTQLLRLVVGHKIKAPGKLLSAESTLPPVDVTVAEERDEAVLQAKVCRRTIRGPECAKSFRRHEVLAIIREEIEAARSTWTFREAAEDVIEPAEPAKGMSN